MNEAKSHITSCPDRPTLGFRCSIARVHRGHHADITWPGDVTDLQVTNGHFTMKYSSRNTKLFPPAQASFSSDGLPPLASVPRWPRHLQRLPELGPLHGFREASETFNTFISLVFSLAATVNMYFQCINIPMSCCNPRDSYCLFSLTIQGQFAL